MTPRAAPTSPQAEREGRGSGFARIAGVSALALIAIAAVVFLLVSGGSSNHYRLLFENGGQLVTGNQVLIGGVPVGSVDEVKLTDHGQAEIEISVDRPLHAGTSAVIRATSLSGIANRYVSIEPGPNNAPELRNGATISAVATTSPVDLDQLFNTLREPERRALREIIGGSAAVYAGRAREANRTYRFLSPALFATDKVFGEVNRDEGVLTSFLVNSASVVSSVAQRRDALTSLVSNANEALGAIASQNRSLDRALVALPPALRQANTTFFNLRPALDDLDPLVNTAKTATRNLAPFLAQVRPVVKKSAPVLADLRPALDRRAKSNDLADAAADLAPLQSKASTAIPATVSAMQESDNELQFLRPYAPDIAAVFAGLDRAAGYYDADGHYIRTAPEGMGIFDYTGGAPPNLAPIPASQIFDAYGPFGSPNDRVRRRCPGGSTQPILGSNPFSAPPFTGQPVGAPAAPGDCNATDVPPGP